ncbi:MAG TPA: branched-chain amino acid ABC transporter permease [Rhodospirillales bacterium]
MQVLGLLGALFFLTAPYALPLVVPDFWVNITAEIMIWALFAASVNLLFGYTGLLSFGQALYFGMGAYGVALSIEFFHFSFWPAALTGIAVATLSAFITGIFAARLTWHYFAIITIVFSLIFFFFAVGWKDVTGGDDGMPFTIPPVLKVGGLELSLLDLTFQYYFILAVVGACFGMMHLLLRSPLGYAFIAVRENTARAGLVGYNAYMVRLLSFVFSGFFAGVSGVLFALFSRYASAHFLFWTVSGEGVVWAIVGGAGTLFGPVLGTAFLIVIREELSAYWEHYLLVVGVIVILFVTYAPDGIMGLLKKAIARYARPAAGDGKGARP